MPEQMKMPGFPTRVLEPADPEGQDPPSPWTRQQVLAMGKGQARNVMSGLHPTGHGMREKEPRHCGTCDHLSKGRCGLVSLTLHGSVHDVKTNYAACVRYSTRVRE